MAIGFPPALRPNAFRIHSERTRSFENRSVDGCNDAHHSVCVRVFKRSPGVLGRRRGPYGGAVGGVCNALGLGGCARVAAAGYTSRIQLIKLEGANCRSVAHLYVNTRTVRVVRLYYIVRYAFNYNIILGSFPVKRTAR